MNQHHSNTPYIIQFPKIGESALGYISVAENSKLPFEIKRVFWTYYTPEEVIRGKHAHYELQQILIAVNGRIKVFTEDINGRKEVFELTNPSQGVFIPRMNWHTMQFSHDAVMVSFSSMEYDENDYIREYELFTALKK